MKIKKRIFEQTRRKFIKSSISTTTTILGTQGIRSSILNAQQKSGKKTNVVLIFIDDLGYADIGPFGSKDIPTPNIDKLAAEGVVCTDTYITNPPCCPSRCSLYMGMYGQRFGKYGMSRGLPIPDDKSTMAEFVRDGGYVTGQIGKWDIGTKAQGPLETGFMEMAKSPPRKKISKGNNASQGSKKKKKNKKSNSKYFCINEEGKEQWLTDYDGDRMVEFIERNKEKPFFLYWSPEAVHSPSKEAPESLTKRTKVDPKNKSRVKLGGCIVSVDDQVGKLLKVLEKNKLKKNTLVIFSSDNGANGSDGGSSAPYRGGKGSGTQQVGWTIIPTIISYPGTIPQNKKYEGMMCTLDFYTTITAVIGKSAPSRLDGVNLLPYLQGKKKGDAHEYLFWLNTDPDDAVRRYLIAVRWKDWRLYKNKELNKWQLFDLKKDPQEKNDLASANPKVVKNMEKQMKEWEKKNIPCKKIPKNIKDSESSDTKGHGWAYAEKK